MALSILSCSNITLNALIATPLILTSFFGLKRRKCSLTRGILGQRASFISIAVAFIIAQGAFVNDHIALLKVIPIVQAD